MYSDVDGYSNRFSMVDAIKEALKLVIDRDFNNLHKYSENPT